MENVELEKPSFEKKIKDTNDSTGETSGWQDSADYDIGDAVPFRLHATLPRDITGYDNYHIKFTDRMEKGLTFNEITSVVVRSSDGGTTVELTPSDYTFTKVSDQEFTLALAWGKNEAVPIFEWLNGADVYVEFTSILNSDAVLGNVGNVNAAKLTYTNNSTPGSENDTEDTPWDYVIAFTYKVGVSKVDQNGKALKGAEFKLEKVDSAGKVISTLDLTVDGNTFSAVGLDDGIYVLTETKAPSGYTKIAPIVFEVKATHAGEWNYTSKELSFNGSSARTAILSDLTGNTTSGSLTLSADKSLSQLTGNVKNTKNQNKRKLPQTSDPTSLTAVYAVAASGLASMAVGLRVRRRRPRDEK